MCSYPVYTAAAYTSGRRASGDLRLHSTHNSTASLLSPSFGITQDTVLMLSLSSTKVDIQDHKHTNKDVNDKTLSAFHLNMQMPTLQASLTQQ